MDPWLISTSVGWVNLSTALLHSQLTYLIDGPLRDPVDELFFLKGCIQVIDSIIRLPEYIKPESPPPLIGINGERACCLYSGMGTNDILDLKHDGRYLSIPSYLFKYKLQFTDYQKNRIYEIVGVTTAELDLSRPNPDPECAIDFYPLYFREYVRSGVARNTGGNTFLHIPSINRLFAELGIPDVCSLAQGFYHCMEIGAVMDFNNVPDEIGDRLIDPDFATTAPYPDDVILHLIDATSYSSRSILQQAVADCCVVEGQFSDKLRYCMNVKRFGQLGCFIDRCHTYSLVEQCVREAQTNWGVIYEWVHLTDDGCPRYLAMDRSESIAQMLHCASLVPTPDFTIECTPAKIAPGIPNGFNPFNFRNERLDSRSVPIRMSTLVHDLFSSEYFVNTNKYSVVGSYLEELLIYDQRNEMVGYIDQVWWILATAYGLLNYNSVII